ncbi:hypothetical protein [Paraburkholderia sp.]|uniref:hypothetical protein n=1 Tax=Paraburkholderia sp. TaxID=1926495 RepID=UPI0025F2C6D2|nr:hypothetical protein [Paraburkholderia sp.]
MVKSVPMPELMQENLADVPPDSLISAAVTLACAQAKTNWPNDQHYDLHIKPKDVVTLTKLTAEEREKIDQAIVQRRKSDERNSPFVEPLLTAQNGKNVCHAMAGSDGNQSSYELCDAQGMFSHDVYSVRVGGIPLLQGIDDNTTKGIDGIFYGSPIRLKCEPVNQLADGVTNKTIEGAIQADRTSSKKISFDDELKFTIMANVVEIGRHCTLSNTDGVMAKLDVVSP